LFDTKTETCTEEELQRELTELLAHPQGEVLTDTEVQDFWRVYQEIQRRPGSKPRVSNSRARSMIGIGALRAPEPWWTGSRGAEISGWNGIPMTERHG
jgi:hypothetical protein